jgi:hypothetical protein
MKIGRVFVLSLTASVSLTVAACSGGNEGPAPVPASGTVTLNGEPLASGNIQFYPTKGRPSGGSIKDGKFTLATPEGNDGAIPGNHNVSVTAYKDVKVAGQSEPQQVLSIPEKYANAASSGITVEIPAGGNKDIKIELK